VTATGKLLRIDLATGAVAQTVPLVGASSNLVLDGNRVIADTGIAGTSTPGELIAVDSQTGHVLARQHQLRSGGPMAAGDGALWEIQEAPTVLQELSPTTLAPIAPPLKLSATAYVHGLAFGGGYVWASEDGTGDVLRIDPTTRSITTAHVGGSPNGIVLAGGSIWVTDDSDAAVLRLSPSTLREIGQPIAVRSGDSFYLGASDGYVFIANATDGTVTRIDTRTGKTAGAPIQVAPASSSNIGAAYAVAPAGAVVWATSPTADTISRIQATP
jgi:DNA-binding beta-propeller fold protein YncE